MDDLTTALEAGLSRSLKAFKRSLIVEGHKHDLTAAQYLALRHLFEAGDQRMSDLATALDLTNSATTGLIERLDARGLVERRPDPEDGRGVRVALTPTGSALLDHMKRAVTAGLHASFERLPAATQYMIVGGVTALADALCPITSPDKTV